MGLLIGRLIVLAGVWLLVVLFVGVVTSTVLVWVLLALQIPKLVVFKLMLIRVVSLGRIVGFIIRFRVVVVVLVIVVGRCVRLLVVLVMRRMVAVLV